MLDAVTSKQRSAERGYLRRTKGHSEGTETRGLASDQVSRTDQSKGEQSQQFVTASDAATKGSDSPNDTTATQHTMPTGDTLQ
eukprot:symbB.v1.2.010636.t1/scaffold692.1/size172456/3